MVPDGCSAVAGDGQDVIELGDEVRAATGFPIGGVPPIGHGLPVVFDSALLDYEVIYAAGGDGNTLFSVSPRQLAGCLHALVAPVGE